MNSKAARDLLREAAEKMLDSGIAYDEVIAYFLAAALTMIYGANEETADRVGKAVNDTLQTEDISGGKNEPRKR